MAEVYKIRNTITGLYSMGGITPRFNKCGKIWKTLGHLHSHLSQLDRTGRHRYEQSKCEIVTLEIQEVVTACVSIKEYILDRDRRILEEMRQTQQKQSDRDTQKRLIMYNQLHKEFGKI